VTGVAAYEPHKLYAELVAVAHKVTCHVSSDMQQTTCDGHHAADSMRQTTCDGHHAADSMRQTTCDGHHAADNMQQTTCDGHHAADNMQRAADNVKQRLVHPAMRHAQRLQCAPKAPAALARVFSSSSFRSATSGTTESRNEPYTWPSNAPRTA
jgi:hypothetical protein